MRPREYTVAEANALLPRVRAWVHELREAVHRAEFLAEQVDDLRAMHGDALADPRRPEHAEHAVLRAELAEAETRVRALRMEFRTAGVEVKDPIVGLVDFYGRRDGDLVYLCWKDGEPDVAHWHPLVGGFAARKPLEDRRT